MTNSIYLSISFLNLSGRIFAFNLSVFANGDIRNAKGTIEAIRKMGIQGKLVINTEESLLESRALKICAQNVVNEKSIIRSLLLEDIDFELNMKEGHFVSNSYVHTTSHGILLPKTPEDQFFSKRNAEIYFKYHKPEEKQAPKVAKDSTDSSGSSGISNEEKKETSADTTSNPENENAEQENSSMEIGSLLNYSGEIISVGNIRFSGSGSLYNISDSIIRAKKDFLINIFGRILNKHRSLIESGEKTEAKTKIGLIYFENSALNSGDCVFSSNDNICFDESSEISGSGTFNLLSESLINRGIIKCNDSINAVCGHLDNSGRIESKADI